MITALAFERLGYERLTAWANTRNGRSQRALERIGFRREGVLTAWHRHGDGVHDVVIFGSSAPPGSAARCTTSPSASRAPPRPRSSSAERARVRWVASTQASTASAATTIAAVTRSPRMSAAHDQRQHRLRELDLPDLGHAAERQPVVPGEEAEEHRDHRHVGEAEPRVVPACRPWLAASVTGIDEERRGEDERPADHLPAAVRAAQRAALGVPERGQRDRGAAPAGPPSRSR